MIADSFGLFHLARSDCMWRMMSCLMVFSAVLLLGADPVFPIVARNKISTGPPYNGNMEFLDEIDEIFPESICVGER